MTIARIRARLIDVAEALRSEGVLPPDAPVAGFRLDPSRAPHGGELTTNAPLTLAKAARGDAPAEPGRPGPEGRTPLELAARFTAALAKAPEIETAEIAGPGFISMTLKRDVWADALGALLRAGARYGRGEAGGKEVCVAHIPRHAHRRSGTLRSPSSAGFSLALDDYRAALFADAMANLFSFAGYTVRRVGAQDLLPPPATIGETIARLAGRRLSGGETGRRGAGRLILVLADDPGVRSGAREAAARALAGRETHIDVRFCHGVSLSGVSLSGVSKAGVSEPDSRPGGNLEQRLKGETPPSRPASLLPPEGLRRDMVKLAMSFHKIDTPLDFDLEKFLDPCWKNPAFCIQYAHARARSTMREFARAQRDLDSGEKNLQDPPLHLLADKAELNVVRWLALFPSVAESAVEVQEPQRVAFFLREVAGVFHALWKWSKESPQFRFIVPDDWELTRARVALATATAGVLETGLGLLGVQAVAEIC